MEKIPYALKRWFLLHFFLDYFIALPLFFFPIQTLTVFNFTIIDPLTARLVACALFAIGGTSLILYTHEKVFYRPLLLVKIIWSITATIALFWSYIENRNPILLLFTALFLFFFCLWTYYYQKEFSK